MCAQTVVCVHGNKFGKQKQHRRRLSRSTDTRWLVTSAVAHLTVSCWSINTQRQPCATSSVTCTQQYTSTVPISAVRRGTLITVYCRVVSGAVGHQYSTRVQHYKRAVRGHFYNAIYLSSVQAGRQYQRTVQYGTSLFTKHVWSARPIGSIRYDCSSVSTSFRNSM